MRDSGALYPARMQDLNAAVPAPMPIPMSSLYKHELPDSQESYMSAVSSTFSAPKLPSTSSDLSTSTTGDAEQILPPLSKAISTQKPVAGISLPSSPSRSRGQDAARFDAAHATRTGDTAASPMSATSPVAQGLKRAADGSVKGSVATEEAAAPIIGHKRNKSMESGRIGQLSAQLRTRLSYAMVKVQNNWEKQSLDELEDQISQHGSPISVASRTPGSRPVFESPTTAERHRRPSAISDTSDQLVMSPGQAWQPGTKSTLNAAASLISVTGSHVGPMLGPAPDLSSRRKRRSSASYHPPPLLSAHQRKHLSDLGTTPRTPSTPRPGILRMPSQQAEKDAVDTLLFMSSPNNSGRLAHTSADTQQGQRHNFAIPQRRVMFETHLANEHGTSHLHPHISSNQPATYYRADPR